MDVMGAKLGKGEERGAPGKMYEGDGEKVRTERSAQMASWRHFRGM